MGRKLPAFARNGAVVHVIVQADVARYAINHTIYASIPVSSPGAHAKIPRSEKRYYRNRMQNETNPTAWR